MTKISSSTQWIKQSKRPSPWITNNNSNSTNPIKLRQYRITHKDNNTLIIATVVVVRNKTRTQQHLWYSLGEMVAVIIIIIVIVIIKVVCLSQGKHALMHSLRKVHLLNLKDI